MKYEDLIKKLENLKVPEIELAGHKRALRTALINSRYFRKRTTVEWVRMLAPVAAALLLVAVVGFFAAIQPDHADLGVNEIKKFASYQELQQFIKTNAGDRQFFWGIFKGDVTLYSRGTEGFFPAPSENNYSPTNIQVLGVDEADIVKTDGEYIYLASGNRIIIVKAYPPEQAQILSEIELVGTVIGVFINGDRLVALEEEIPYHVYYGIRLESEERFYIPYIPPKTQIKVYDVSDRGNTRLEREISTNGQYVSSRMIGDYVYLVVNEPVQQDGQVNLPKLSDGGVEKEIAATEIYYCDVRDYYYMYTTVIAVNTQNDDQEPAYETILLGASSNVYVSPNNIYLTFPVWGGDVGDFQGTSIHRIQIDRDEMEYVASGRVPGMVLNQFSMDEYDGYFRVATTTHAETTRNNVYVLDMDLNIVGSLSKDLAPGEIIYSARFIGERCYLVTFMTTDPLFVIDLSNPYAPEVLGYLKIPGYSNYLHPYDENHIIGIGKEAVAAEEGDFAWYQGVKIALFDVSDVTKPKEVGEPIVIGDRGTDSPVLWDHKAFLLHKARNLMVIPVLEAKINPAQYPEGVPSWAYGEPVWQGVYVFDVSAEQGLRVKGKISHVDNAAESDQGYYYYGPFAVERSLYIHDILYTISQAKIKMNSLGDLSYINEVKLPYSTWTPYEYFPGEIRSEEPSGGVEAETEGLQK